MSGDHALSGEDLKGPSHLSSIQIDAAHTARDLTLVVTSEVPGTSPFSSSIPSAT